MKKKLVYWCVCWALVFLVVPLSAGAAALPVGVSYRGHIQDRGDYPLDGSWVDSPDLIGTVGQSKRIEGFEIKLTGDVPSGLELHYNVHVQNKGWLYEEEDYSDWPRDGAYAGTRGESLRIEAVKIVLTDYDGKPISGYSVQYRGHVQDMGDLPADKNQWLADGEQLGTVGSSLRLEALLVQVVKTAVDPPQPVVYEAAGSYGPATGSETITGDVTVAADGVVLNNLVIDGDLTISEAVGDGTVTLNNVIVTGDTLVRGGGKNSIHINGGEYSRIVMEKTASGAVRIVATGVDGLEVVVAEDATGETIILEGAFANVTVNAPNMVVTTQGMTTTIGTLTVGTAGAGATLNLASGTTVNEMVLDGKAAVKGQGTVTKADVNADGVVFDKVPGSYVVEPDVVIPPVFPNPGGSGGGTPSKPTLTIDFPTLTVTKVYDGSTSAAVTAGSLSGVAAGDVGNVNVTAVASYDTKNVGSGKTIRVVYTLGGSAAAKYNKPADLVINTGTIVAKALTIADPTLTLAKEYDGNTCAAVTAGELIGKETGDTVTVTPTAHYNDATRADNKTITVDYTLGGADAGNYRAPAQYQVTNGEIAKKQLTINLTSLTTAKEYNGNTTAAAVGNLVGKVDGEDVAVDIEAVYENKDVGDIKTITISYTINGNDIDNYLAPVMETRAGKITPKPLTVTSVTAVQAKVYDGNNSTAATVISFAGKVGAEAIGLAATASYNDKTVGTGKPITVSYSLTGDPAVTANYSAPDDYVVNDGMITARPLTITTVPTVTTSKPYDGKTTAAVTGNAATDAIIGDQLIVTPTASYNNASVNTNKAITINYALSGADAGNYSVPAADTVTGAISKRTLSYMIGSAYPTKEYDQTITAPITVSDIGNIVGSEEVSIATMANYESKDVGSGKPVTIVMTLTGADSGNYQVTVPHLTGAITAKPLAASGVMVTTTKEYDGQTGAAITANGTVTGQLPGESVSATPVANYNDKKAGENKPITISYSLTGDPAVTKNYSAPASYEYDTKGTITPRDAAITGIQVNKTKEYDGTTAAQVTNHGIIYSKVTGDDVAVTTTANFASAAAGNNISVSCTTALSGADKDNYTSGSFALGPGVINPKQLYTNPLQLTTSKLFDGNNNAVVTAGPLYGVVDGETVTITDATATYDTAEIGTGKPITVVYNISDTTGNYYKPANYTTMGEIKKDLLVTSYNGSWSTPSAANAPVFARLPAGYSIFDWDNTGVVYAGASDGTIKKYSGGSWSDAFNNTNKPTGLQFAGIDIYEGKSTAIGVDLSNDNFYENGPNTSSQWQLNGSIINPNNYQLVGSYYDTSNFYLVYQNGINLYKYDPYSGSNMMDAIPGGVSIPAGYSICGFNYTSQLNMYLTK